MLLAYVIIVTFNYKNLCPIALNFIHCKNINGVSVLYISGETECFENWQIANACLLLFCVIPFPFALSTANYLHKQKYIDTFKCMVCVIVPISVPIFAILAWTGRIRRDKKNEERLFGNELFQMFEESYRSNFFWWESYRLYERFLMTAIITFVINPIKRTIILCPLFVLFL